MEILDIELVPKSGVQIEFLSRNNVRKDDYFKIAVNNTDYSFKTIGIKVVGEQLRVTAVEFGYRTLSKADVDLRTLRYAVATPITEAEEIRKLVKESTYC